jgi:hypothetical protein
MVLRMSNADAAALRRLLDAAADMLREYAAEQSYRRDAMKAIRERMLAEYHDHRTNDALAMIDAMTVLADALDAPGEREWTAGQVPRVTRHLSTSADGYRRAGPGAVIGHAEPVPVVDRLTQQGEITD